MKKQQRYTPEFRAEAVKLVTEQRLSQKEAAKRLAIPKGTLAHWMAAAKASPCPSAPGRRSAPDTSPIPCQTLRNLAGNSSFCPGREIPPWGSCNQTFTSGGDWAAQIHRAAWGAPCRPDRRRAVRYSCSVGTVGAETV